MEYLKTENDIVYIRKEKARRRRKSKVLFFSSRTAPKPLSSLLTVLKPPLPPSIVAPSPYQKPNK
jgi:hypothetical protein